MKRSDDFNEIISSIDMEAWMDREGIAYKLNRGARGMQLNCRECAICGDTHWKVYVGAETGLGNCFKCETKFNRWSFIKANMGSASNGQVMEHIRTVAREQGWRPARTTSVAVNMNTLTVPKSHALPIGTRNLKYLTNRNITNDIASYFGLRFCQNGAFRYEGEDGRPRLQSYANRIIIPIFDLDGDLVSFQGRDITGTAERKYLFPPGFSSTGSHLFNGQNALGSEDVVIGEGAFDVMAIKIALDQQPELRHVTPVGSFGKHLSIGSENSQLAKLLTLKAKGLKRVTIAWDGESAALEAAAETALVLKSYGLMARVAVLPAGKDPNEIAASVMRDAFWKAVPANTMTMMKLKLMAERMK